MPKKIIPQLPREDPQAAWPRLLVSPEDRHYVPQPESPMARRWRLMGASMDVFVLDATFATFKGAALGLFVFAVTFSFITLRLSGFCWLVGWHWAFAIGAILLLLMLTGFEFTLLIIAAVALWLSLGSFIAQPKLLLLFIGVGVLLRLIIEFFPRKDI